MSEFDAKAFLATLTSRPGVYQMFDQDGQLLYVGKAKNLKNRVTSYFRASGLTAKTMALVNRIRHIEVTVTTTEVDALLLEHNLIKEHRPPYNISLKDDKSYPYIYLSSQDRWPRLGLHRGPKRRKGEYFGPYPSAGAVRSTLHLLQKVLKVRQCQDSYFRNRSRPCLQYQIGRCSGPCVGLVSDEDYQEQVEKTVLFLKGKSQELMSRLADEMEAASADLRFEDAAERRDQLMQLQKYSLSRVLKAHGVIWIFLLPCRPAGRPVCRCCLFVRPGYWAVAPITRRLGWTRTQARCWKGSCPNSICQASRSFPTRLFSMCCRTALICWSRR